MRYYLPTKLPELMDFTDKRVLIFGLGTFGGGVGAARFLANKGAKVSVTDLRSKAELQESIDAIANENVEYFLGNHDWVDIPAYDLICVNPAVNPFHPMLLEAEEKGVPTTSEMNLFFAYCKGRIVGVTGSNGKSTTAALTAKLLEGSGRKVWFGGNIGHSLLPEVDQIGEKDVVVLELSSFQLEDLHKLRMSPTVSILTNLSNNHLDRHKSYDAYFAAKMSAFCYQKSNNISIINYDDPAAMQMLSYVSGRIMTYSTSRVLKPGGFIQNGEFWADLGKGAKPIAKIGDLKIAGRFNQSNALAAITAASVFKTPPAEIRPLLREFNGLEHRLEFVQEKSGVKFYNDSISTTPESTIAGISAFSQPTWLIVGGSDKGMNYGLMALKILRSPVIGVLGIGEIGKNIVELIKRINQAKNVRRNLVVQYKETLENCFDYLNSNAKPGHVVLMSPGTASYDQFRNFEARGEMFRSLVSVFRDSDGGYGDVGQIHRTDSRIIRESAFSKPSDQNEDEELSKAIQNLSEDSRIYKKDQFDQDPTFQDFPGTGSDMISDFPEEQFEFESGDSFEIDQDLFSDNDFAEMLEQTINAAFDDDDSGKQAEFGDDFLDNQQEDPQMMDFENENLISFEDGFDESVPEVHFGEQSEMPFPDPGDSKPLFQDEVDMLEPIDTQHLTRDYLDKFRKEHRKKKYDDEYDDDELREI